MKEIQKHKYVIITVLVFIALVLIGYKGLEYISPSSKKAIYGNRLANIESIKITKEQYSEIITALEDNDKVESVTYDLHGKIIYFSIKVKSDVSVDDAKKIGNSILAMDTFSEEEKDYYSFQVIITKEDEKQNNFPIIGYRHNTNETFVYTKDREVTTDEE